MTIIGGGDIKPEPEQPQTWDVTVRIPVAFESSADAAGFVHVAVAEAMAANGWRGDPMVLFRSDGGGPIIAFHGGIIDPYSGVLPHDLTDTMPDDEPIIAALQELVDVHGVEVIDRASAKLQARRVLT